MERCGPGRYPHDMTGQEVLRRDKVQVGCMGVAVSMGQKKVGDGYKKDLWIC